jgi:hypothetical protein
MNNPRIVIEEMIEDGVKKFSIKYEMINNFKRMELLSNAVLNFIYISTQGEYEKLREQIKKDFINIIEKEDFKSSAYENINEEKYTNFN